MRLRILTACAAIGSAGVATAADMAAPVEQQVQAEQSRWSGTASLDFKYFSYEGTRGTTAPAAPAAERGRGSQFYMPIALQIVGAPTDELKIELMARTGYVTSHQSTATFSGNYSGSTDTVVSATATYLGWAGIQPYLSVNLNLPTGETVLRGTAGRARLDPDFVDVPTFGEGFNIGPTIGANIPIMANLLLNLSAGYTHRGEFTREGQVDPFTGIQGLSRLNPGEAFTLSGSLNYSEGAFTGQVTMSYSHDTATAIEGIRTFRSGNRFSINGSGTYAFDENWSATVTAMFSHGEANFAANPALGFPGLLREAINSNSNLYRVGFEPTYRVSPAWSIGPTASFLYRDQNAYNVLTSQFVPAKTRYTLGGFTSYSVTNAISLTARVERVWTREDANPDKFEPVFNAIVPGSGVPRLSYNGWQVSGGVSARF
jgi:hypothetical protein